MVTPVTRSKTINSLGLEMKKIAQGNKKYIKTYICKISSEQFYMQSTIFF